MALKPWYDVVKPREDLAKGRPLDASEFAVHLNHVRDGKAPDVYQKPAEFFDRTFITQNLRALAVEVARRLSGIKVQTSPVFNLTTNFGGGKTHSLLCLYHLAQGGKDAAKWKGVQQLLSEAGLSAMPEASVGVFVGTEFDPFAGRGGDNGEPHRRTPWGDLAFQIGGSKGFQLLAQHDEALTAPGGDVIEKVIPTDRACLILVDELMNFVNRARQQGKGLDSQLYTFLHNLSEVVRARDNVVLAASIPASELEMTAEDQEDYTRIKKLLDRVGKAVIMSSDTETSEIIRRRLFVWEGIPKDGIDAIKEYAGWIQTNKSFLPPDFNLDDAVGVLRSTYPFHPTVLSVFERKWQTLPRFQQTRGVLRLLALWVSHAYKEGYSTLNKESLITLGTAPLGDPTFRQAVFEQLGADKLEAAVTTDIAGPVSAHAQKLDKEALPAVKKARLHEKIATAVFFESNGGQTHNVASEAEVRLAVGEPNVEIASVEQCLGTLVENCYYLTAEKKNFRFSFTPNLNKLLADKRAVVHDKDIDDRVRAEVQTVFSAGGLFKPVFFPDESAKIPDQPALALVVLPPDQASSDKNTEKLIDSMVKEHGSKSRTHKSGVLFAVAESGAPMRDDARKLLAWERIQDEQALLKLDDAQKTQVLEHIQKAKRDLKEAVWRCYRYVYLLGKANQAERVDLGLMHSDAQGIQKHIVDHLKKSDVLLDKAAAPTELTKHWPPASPEWSTRSVRDMFYASPLLSRLLRPELVRDTIARGVKEGFFAYVGKTTDGGFHPFRFKVELTDIDLVDDMFLVPRDAAEAYEKNKCPSCGARPPAWLAGEALCQNCGHGKKPKCPSCAKEPPAWDANANKCTACGYGEKPACPTCKAEAPKWRVAESQCDACGHGKAQACPKCGATPPAWDVVNKECGACGKPPPEFSTITWTGDVPAQKWTNFYTKVLSKFATGSTLKLTVSVEIKPSTKASPQKVEETKAALRDLGLSDDVKTTE